MSRELLKRALDYMNQGDWEYPQYMGLIRDIETYLAQPDPEPVAWMTIDRDEHKRCRMVRLSQAVLNEYDLTQYPLYTSPPDQSARIAELSQSDKNCLEAEIANRGKRIDELTNQMSEIASAHMHLLIKHQALEQQLATLQAKREPLTQSTIIDAFKDKFIDQFIEDTEAEEYGAALIAFIKGARFAEAAHEIGGE